MTKQKNIQEYVGKLLKNLTPLHDKESRSLFNLNEDTFFQKLIPRELMEKGVRVIPEDYFKALVSLNYFTRILEKDYAVCDNLVSLSKALRKEERERGEDGKASYLNLNLVVIEIALLAKERLLNEGKKEHYSNKKINEIKKRYNEEPSINLNSPNVRQSEPYYEGIGEMVCSLVGDKIKPFLKYAKRRTELEALVFTNSFLPLLKPKEAQKVYNELSKKDYFSASIAALNQLAKRSSISQIKSILEDKND